MILSWIWTGMAVTALLWGAASGQIGELGAAALDGAAGAVETVLGICGGICLWSGVMEVMARCGIAEGLSRLLRPVLRRLFPQSMRDGETGRAIAENVSANLLGLGNAATPAGIRAAKGMEENGNPGELCRFLILNTASIQLFPSTVCALRSAMGSEDPFGILPAVWLSGLCSVTAGLLSGEVLRRLWKN